MIDIYIYEHFYQCAASLNSEGLYVVCGRSTVCQFTSGIVGGGAWVLLLSRLHSLTHLSMFKILTDKKLKLFNDYVNYKNIIYYILLVSAILSKSLKNISLQLKPLPK